MFATRLGLAIGGLFGVGLLVIGLISAGLTQAPRPKDISPSIFSKLNQMEWVIAILFIPLGIWMVRLVVVRFSKPADQAPPPGEL